MCLTFGAAFSLGGLLIPEDITKVLSREPLEGKTRPTKRRGCLANLSCFGLGPQRDSPPEYK